MFSFYSGVDRYKAFVQVSSWGDDVILCGRGVVRRFVQVRSCGDDVVRRVKANGAIASIDNGWGSVGRSSGVRGG